MHTPIGAPHLGPSEADREWCLEADDNLSHSFDGWTVHRSPTAAVASEPEDWILLTGELLVDRGRVVVCALEGCADSVPTTLGVEPIDPVRKLPSLFGTSWIARVRDGALVGLTRVLPERQ